MSKQKIRYGNELNPNYPRWLSMNQRCNNANHDEYRDYGGRGIIISKEFEDFNFYSTYINNLPKNSEEDSIDRIDVNGNYEIGNIRWASKSLQVVNQRETGRSNHTYRGVTLCSPARRKAMPNGKHWVAEIHYQSKKLFHAYFFTEEEALAARNNFIITNSLPHKIQPYK